MAISPQDALTLTAAERERVSIAELGIDGEIKASWRGVGEAIVHPPLLTPRELEDLRKRFERAGWTVLSRKDTSTNERWWELRPRQTVPAIWST